MRSCSRRHLALILPILAGAPAIAQSDSGYRAATGLLNRGNYDLAAAEYRAFLEAQPNGPKAAAARYGLAICLSRLGQWKDAAAQLDQIANHTGFEFAPDALLLRAQCATALGDHAGAIPPLRAVLKDYKSFDRCDAAAVLLAESEYRLGKHDDAAAAVARFRDSRPDSNFAPRAELVLALCEIAKGDDRAAAARLARLRAGNSDLAGPAALYEAQCRHRLGELDPALEAYRQAAGVAGFSDQASLGIAQILRTRGDAAAAAKLLDELLSKVTVGQLRDAAALERARVWFDLGDPAKAMLVLEPLCSSAEGSPDQAEYWSAKCELKLAKPEAAARRLARAASRYPKSVLQPEILFDLAVALDRSGSVDEASRAYQLMRDKFPDHPLSRESLAAQAVLEHARGDYAASRRLCEAFLASEPAPARRAEAQLLLAENDFMSDQFRAAEKEFAAFIKANPGHQQARRASIRRGLALARLGQAEEAESVLSGALKLDGLDPALRAGALAVLGDAAYARADWPSAERAYRALSEPSANADVLLRLAVCVQRQGRTDDALVLLDQAISRGPEGPATLQARFEKAQALVGLKRLDEAAILFNDVLERSSAAPDDRFQTPCLRHLASIAQSRGKSAEAAELLQRIAKVDPGEAGQAAAFDRGMALLASGNYAQAEAALKEFIGRAAKGPRQDEARARLVIAVSRQGRFAEAIRLSEQIPADSLPAEVRAALQYEHAWALKHDGKPEQAAVIYASLLPASPDPLLTAHAALDLATIQHDAGDASSALDSVGRALVGFKAVGATDPAADEALYLRGVCELKLERFEPASATFAQLLKQSPDGTLAASASLLRAQTLLKSGAAGPAAQQAAALIDTKPAPELLAPALLCLGEASGVLQKWDASGSAFTRFLREFSSDPSAFQARFGAAWAMENQGRHEEAIRAYRDLIEHHAGATAARAQFQIGECLYAMKRLEEAARELLKVDILFSYPEWSAAALYEAGRCLIDMGRPAEAREQFRQVVSRFPETDWARLATQKLADTASAPLPGRAEGSRTAPGTP